MSVRTSITPEQKKRRFRQLAKQARIRTARELAEELEQPYLPLINLEITVKCHVTEGESRPIPFKNGLSVRFGSDDSGTPRSAR